MELKRLSIIVVVLLAVTFLVAACQGTEQEDISLDASPLEVEFGTNADSTLTLDQTIELSIQVTQDGDEVEDAEEVSFEMWYAGEDEHETLPAQHQGNGMYTISKTLEQEGTLNVMYHVTARGYHSMKKHEIMVEK
jgi:predicted small secreted protein